MIDARRDPAEGPGHGHRAHAGGQGAARQARATTRCSAPGRCAARSSARSRTSLSEKILFGELGPGQIVVVDVEGEGTEQRSSPSAGRRRPSCPTRRRSRPPTRNSATLRRTPPGMSTRGRSAVGPPGSAHGADQCAPRTVPISALRARCRSVRSAHGADQCAPRTFSSTTPNTMHPSARVLTASRRSPSTATPTRATRAVPAPDQIAYVDRDRYVRDDPSQQEDGHRVPAQHESRPERIGEAGGARKRGGGRDFDDDGDCQQQRCDRHG